MKKEYKGKVVEKEKRNFFIHNLPGIILIIIFIIAVIVFLINLFLSKKERMGFYYKDRYDLSNQNNWVISEPLKSYDECLSRLNSVKKWNDDYDSECGYRCKKVQGFYGDIYSCEDTRKGIGFNLELEEIQKKAVENAGKQKQLDEEIDIKKQLKIEVPVQDGKNAQCDKLRNDANEEIENIQKMKTTVACDNLNGINSQIAQYKNKIANIRYEAKNAFKGDVPQYMIDSYASNKKAEYQNQIDILERQLYNVTILCSDENKNNAWADNMILQRKETIINNGCSF